MADIRHQPGGSEKMNAPNKMALLRNVGQNEPPSRAARSAIYEESSTLGVENVQRLR